MTLKAVPPKKKRPAATPRDIALNDYQRDLLRWFITNAPYKSEFQVKDTASKEFWNAMLAFMRHKAFDIAPGTKPEDKTLQFNKYKALDLLFKVEEKERPQNRFQQTLAPTEPDEPPKLTIAASNNTTARANERAP